MWPVAKKIGRELFVQAATEIVDVVTKKKSPKEALKSSDQKTVKKQVGGSRARIGGVRGGNVYQKQKQNGPVKSRKIIQRKQPLLRSRSDFFSKVKNE